MVSWLTNVEEDGTIDWYGVKRATDWHTDSTYEPELPLLAMLHALEVPSRKGGTMFANMQAAYDALPEAVKGRLAGLVGLHGRSSGPAGERLYGDERGRRRRNTPSCPAPPSSRTRSPGARSCLSIRCTRTVLSEWTATPPGN